MNVSQNIRGVTKVRAVRLAPEISNAVTIRIETEGGVVEQTLFFGFDEKSAGDARMLFAMLGGKAEDVVGENNEHV